MIGMRRVNGADAGLNFKSGKIVVFEFCAQDRFQPFRHDGDFVLQKCTVKIARVSSIVLERVSEKKAGPE